MSRSRSSGVSSACQRRKRAMASVIWPAYTELWATVRRSVRPPRRSRAISASSVPAIPSERRRRLSLICLASTGLPLICSRSRWSCSSLSTSGSGMTVGDGGQPGGCQVAALECAIHNAAEQAEDDGTGGVDDGRCLVNEPKHVIESELLPADGRRQVGEVLVRRVAGVPVPSGIDIDNATLNVDPELLQAFGEMPHSVAKFPDGPPVAAEPVGHPVEDVDSGQLGDSGVDPC